MKWGQFSLASERKSLAIFTPTVGGALHKSIGTTQSRIFFFSKVARDMMTQRYFEKALAPTKLAFFSYCSAFFASVLLLQAFWTCWAWAVISSDFITRRWCGNICRLGSMMNEYGASNDGRDDWRMLLYRYFYVQASAFRQTLSKRTCMELDWRRQVQSPIMAEPWCVHSQSMIDFREKKAGAWYQHCMHGSRGIDTWLCILDYTATIILLLETRSKSWCISSVSCPLGWSQIAFPLSAFSGKQHRSHLAVSPHERH